MVGGGLRGREYYSSSIGREKCVITSWIRLKLYRDSRVGFHVPEFCDSAASPHISMDRHRRERLRSRSPEPRNRKQRERSPRSRRVHDAPRTLPFVAREITKHDLTQYRPMFALYLDIQKQIDIDELEDDEVKGRWKSFVHKW